MPGTQTINEDASRVFNAAGGNLISISDVDAGTGNMTVTLTVTHGTLTPTTGGGAVIGNSGTATVTINGTQTAGQRRAERPQLHADRRFQRLGHAHHHHQRQRQCRRRPRQYRRRQ